MNNGNLFCTELEAGSLPSVRFWQGSSPRMRAREAGPERGSRQAGASYKGTNPIHGGSTMTSPDPLHLPRPHLHELGGAPTFSP